jgi:hypothetical protein
MDVRCSTCFEPWDIHHLKHDEIYDTDLHEAECEAWQNLEPEEQLYGRYREKFKANGWEFGRTVLNVVRCPACPKEAKPNAIHFEAKSMLENLLADDPDALATILEDYNL